MRSRIEITVLLLLSAIVLSQSSLLEFFRHVAGNRDFVLDGEMRFHVKGENGFSDFEIDAVVVIRNLEDLCIYVRKPSVISGIKFAYIRRSNRLYSGFGDKIDLNVVYTKENFVENLFLAFVDIVTSPFFKYSVSKLDGRELYRFFPGPREFLSRVGIEPITIDAIFVSGELKELKIFGESEDEYVEITFRRFEAGADVEKIFETTDGGYPLCCVLSPDADLDEVLE